MSDGRAGDSNGQHRVLFVDDSRLMRFAAQRFLRDEFDVLLAENGAQAWQMLNDDPAISAVVTDLNMPDIDGTELIRLIRSSSGRLHDMPILVVTGTDEKSGRRAAMDAGANDLVPKPFSGQDLVDPLREYRRRAERRRHADHEESRPRRHPNIEHTRDGLVDRLDQLGSFHDRHGLDLGVLHVRLDNYDEVAERFGLNWAESLMRHVERVLAREVRVEDTIGRSGDDSYSILLMATPAAGAKRLRDRLRRHLARNPARYPGKTMDAEVSFAIQVPDFASGRPAAVLLTEGLQRLTQPANVTRLADRIRA